MRTILLAIAGAAASAATGLVTNALTDSWSWALLGALAVFVVAEAVVAVTTPTTRRIRMRARGKDSLIEASQPTIRTPNSAGITMTSGRGGTIRNSSPTISDS